MKQKKCFACEEMFTDFSELYKHADAEHPSSEDNLTCTCGMGPEHSANLSRLGDKETSQPETWCRARLVNWILEEGMNLFHPPEGWYMFGHHAGFGPTPDLEFWGEDEGGLPIWERPVNIGSSEQ